MKKLGVGLTILFTIAIGAIVLVQRTTAFKEVDRVLHSGLFGLISTQAVRLSVANLARRQEACDFQFTFIDAQGVTVRQSREQLTAGQSGFWDVGFQEVDTPRDPLGRKSLRVEIEGFHTDLGALCLASLEIVSRRTGATELLIGDPNQIPAAVP